MTVREVSRNITGMTSVNRLLRLSAIWCETNARSQSRLATIVANDGKLFDRIAAGGSCTMATFDRFLTFFGKEENWTGGVPAEALTLLNAPSADAA